ncbi:MAG: LysM domain-containing protein [Phormidesmis sp.]
MFDPRSRYYSLEEAIFEQPTDGRTAARNSIAYKRRRFLPQGRDLVALAEVTVTQGERLDLLAHRLMGDSEQYWQICDANDTLNPATLLAAFESVQSAQEPFNGVFNQVLRVPLPQAY